MDTQKAKKFVVGSMVVAQVALGIINAAMVRIGSKETNEKNLEIDKRVNNYLDNLGKEFERRFPKQE